MLNLLSGFYRKDHLQKHEQVHQKNKKSPATKSKKALPDLFPIKMMPNTVKRPGPSSSKDVKPEITITVSYETRIQIDQNKRHYKNPNMGNH